MMIESKRELVAAMQIEYQAAICVLPEHRLQLSNVYDDLMAMYEAGNYPEELIYKMYQTAVDTLA